MKPMLPEPPECGTPCGLCESLAHDNARLREELDAEKQKYAGCYFAWRESEAKLRAEVERLTKELSYHKISAETCAMVARDKIAAEQRAEAAEADREQLDWLDGQGEPETYEDAPHALVWSVIGDPGQRSIRAAIDAARAKGGAK
jgi:hypothetical protein